MAPAFKLTYFPFKGLGEPIRYLLSYGGIEFEDCRIDQEVWPQIKPRMPFGQMPVLEHSGKVIHQSLAICKYLAKQVELVGKDDWEDMEIDAAVHTFNDFCNHICKYYYETDEQHKEKLKGPLFKETIPFYLERLDKMARENNGYLAAGRLTWADIFYSTQVEYINGILKIDLIENHPNLVAVMKNVQEIPAIKAWIAKRPKSEF